jgi:hypothetical protein
MWKHSPSNRTGQVPWPSVAQLWRHESSPPFPQSKHPQPSNFRPRQSSQA